MKKVKVGIIGFGKHGSHYVRRFLETDICKNVELIAIAENNQTRLNWAKEHLSGVALFDDAIKMLDSNLIEACLIVAPHPEHCHLTMECFKRGIHVLCEKPLSIYADEAKSIIKEYKQNYSDLVFAVMLNQRENPIHKKLKEILDKKEYGNVRRIDWNLTNWYRNQIYFDESYWHATWIGEGGGLITNQAIHQLDLWQWFFGMPDRVFAKLGYGKAHDIETDDEATVLFEYDNGVCGTFITSTNDILGKNILKIQTDEASILLQENKIIIRQINEEKSLNKEKYQLMYKKPPYEEIEITSDEIDLKHEAVVNNFINAVINKTKMKPAPEEALNSVILSNSIYLSSFLNKEIRIPCDEKLYKIELLKRIENSHYRSSATDSLSGILSSYDDKIETGYNNKIK